MFSQGCSACLGVRGWFLPALFFAGAAGSVRVRHKRTVRTRVCLALVLTDTTTVDKVYTRKAPVLTDQATQGRK
jgi:hypothetical protein